MGRKTTGRPSSRPLTPIDWKKVDGMILSGSCGAEIAGALGIHPDTFYIRFEKEYGIGFTAYRPSRSKGGDGMIRARQFQSAMHGNTRMLEMLGKERLGQGKKDELKELINDAVRDAIRELGEESGVPTFSRSILENESSILDQGRNGKESEVQDELGSRNPMEGATQL